MQIKKKIDPLSGLPFADGAREKTSFLIAEKLFKYWQDLALETDINVATNGALAFLYNVMETVIENCPPEKREMYVKGLRSGMIGLKRDVDINILGDTVL